MADVLMTTPTKLTASENSVTTYESTIETSNDDHIKSESNSDQTTLDTSYDDPASSNQPEMMMFDTPQGKPSGRTKACKDCRKSKVRFPSHLLLSYG